MDKQAFQENLNKRVKIVCGDGFVYHCKILEVLDTSVKIQDRFGSILWIGFDNVERLLNSSEGGVAE